MPVPLVVPHLVHLQVVLHQPLALQMPLLVRVLPVQALELVLEAQRPLVPLHKMFQQLKHQLQRTLAALPTSNAMS